MTEQHTTAVKYYYKRYREHGYTALAAWNSARSEVFFRQQLTKRVRESEKRSKAAKRAWKRRKQAS